MSEDIVPFGAWKSLISETMVAGGSIRLASPIRIRSQQGDALVAWVESRPDENGRGAIVARPQSGPVGDLVEAPYSARSKVHEYGGGALFSGDGGLFFVNADDQDIYLIQDNGLERVTREPGLRFADGCSNFSGDRLYAVAERHREGHDPAPENFIARIIGGKVDAVCSGADFYAAPRISPDGKWLAWLQWNLPHMPWEAAGLYIAAIGDAGQCGAPVFVAGGIDAPVFQPEWGGGDKLYYVMEQGDWSELFVHDPDTGRGRQITNLEGELARPLWGLGTRSYALLDDGQIAAILIRNGEHQMVLIDPAGGGSRVIDQPHRQLLDLVCAPDGKSIVAIAHDDFSTPSIVEVDMAGTSILVHRPGRLSILQDDISVGETRMFRAADGRRVYAVYYPPCNSKYPGAGEGRPPLIVSAHGGPTGMADRGLKLKIQYWTSRGFAFVDVDYRGSTGYGQAYRAALDGFWGERDAEDVLSVVRALIGDNICDPEALFISGGSAGGFTVLMALVTGDVFKAGCVSYGVADLSRLLATTHKFEAGYLYALTGTSDGDTEPEFTTRSPIYQAARISSPVLFLQGLDDKVVPPEQSRMMAETLLNNGVAAKLVEFPGEGHGFRGAETICRALTEEYTFYAEFLGFKVGEKDQ